MGKRSSRTAAEAAKPAVFVGSSAESATIANAIHLSLVHGFRVTPWTAGAFRPGERPLASIERQAGRSDYGIFIFTPDDVVVSRKRRKDAVRDNVLFELGLFIGKLGADNCFVMVPEGWADMKMPSDLMGYQPVQYESGRLATESPQIAVSAALPEA